VTVRGGRGWIVGVVAGTLTVSACGGSSPYAEQALAESGRPIYIVLDTSQSMEDVIGSTPKITSAQRAVTGLIDSLDGSHAVALHTYPDRDPSVGCTDGQLDLALDEHEPEMVRSAIANLYPSGDTPTAEALQRVASDVMALDEQVSLLLISDGESNCLPPCPVARELADRTGWNVVVVGFDVSGGALGELQCIADESDGRYLTVDDGAQLEELFSNPEALFTVSG
jgi:Ca-activated chloride channel homolog